MEAIIEEITKEVSVYFSLRTVIKDLLRNDTYEIKEINKGGLLLEHKPILRGEQRSDLQIGYDELVILFPKDRFFISGFSSVTENGNKHDVEKLKRAIKDTRDKIELEERTAESQKQEKEKNRLLLKRKTKIALRKTIAEVQFEEKQKADRIKQQQEELEAKLAKEEEERLEKIVHDKKIKILNIKKNSQQQRFRFFHKNI